MVFAEVDRPEQFEQAFATVQREQADALYAAGSGAVGYAPVAGSVWNSGGGSGGWPDVYGVNLAGLWRQIAALVDKIFKGAKPAELPIEQPTKFLSISRQPGR
jgi:hypothetical protein